MKFIQILILAMGLAVSGCSSAPVATTVEKADPAKQYRETKERLEKTKEISPGFTLRVRHSSDAAISGDYRVSFKGTVKLPYSVNVEAAGLTPAELEPKLAQAYSSYFRAGNSISVEIGAREYLLEVRGLVAKPGVYPVKLDTSLEEVISLAGGLAGGGGDAKNATVASKPEWVRIVRPDFAVKKGEGAVQWVRLSDYFLKYDVRNELLWRGGEVLFFQVAGDPQAAKAVSSSLIQILGEVHKPGEYPLQPGADLFTYLTQAGGQTSQADMESITIVHKADNDTEVFNLTKGTSTPELKPGDVIMVRALTTKPSFIEKALPLLLAATSIVTSIFLIIFAL